jgi:phytanoyl-CoA hydroxylase
VRTALDPGAVGAYRRDGFLVVRGLLEALECDELDAAVTRAIAAMGAHRVATNHALTATVERRERVVVQRVNLWSVDPVVARYVLGPALGGMLAALAGVDGLRLLHDQTFFKPPWADGIALHRDLPNWPFDDRRALQVWIALDAADRANGCLAYLPASHDVGAGATAPIRGSMARLLDEEPRLADVEPVLVEVDRGDAVVHSGMVVHASGANLSPRWRRALTAQYFPDGARFNGVRSVLSDDQLRSLAVGDPLGETTGHPLVWSRPDGGPVGDDGPLAPTRGPDAGPTGGHDGPVGGPRRGQ